MSFRHNNNHVFNYPYGSQANFSHQHNSYIPDGNSLSNEESNFWSINSPRSDSQSPTVTIGQHPYHTYSNLTFVSGEICHSQYRSGCNLNSVAENDSANGMTPLPFVRVVKRRTTANKKERRRTQSINNAYADLRDCIPNVPPDTKLSKIKTLRLATSYISYLTAVLETDEPAGAFRVEISTSSRRSSSVPIEANDHSENRAECINVEGATNNSRRGKGRTGWPQHVWALELKQEQSH